ncbi:MAG: protein kinase [Planctomycetota bacterium JB042]
MDTDRFARVRAIFEEVEGLPREEALRVARLRTEGDDALFGEVAALLDAEEGGDELLDSWVRALDEARESTVESRVVGRRIGEFTIRRVIGSGGMGTVFEAEQDEPRRVVALKTLRDSFASEEARERFRWESRLLARLEHPAIARVYAVGTFRSEGEGPTPYFAMEYVEGARTIRDWVERERPSRAASLLRFREICDAVQHGHDRGVLHRDLKPQNLLVDGEGNPKGIDFGVARALDPEVTAPRTSAGELMGTLAYMSPEQVAGPSDEVDVRTDVYALGVVLYELLCGRKPIALDGRSLGEAVAAIRDEQPTRPGEVDPTLRGDLEWICLRALEKDPERRYASPAALADDVRRHLEDLPVSAGPPGPIYRLRKFVRRNRAAVALGAAVVIAVVVGAAVSLDQFQRAEAEAASRGRVSQFLADMLTLARPEVAEGPEPTVRELLDWAAGELPVRFGERSPEAAMLHDTIGEAYLALGRYPEAEQHLLRATELIEAAWGTDSYAHVAMLSSLARLASQRGRNDEALEILERILPLVRRYLRGDSDKLTAHLLNYAVTLFEVGRVEEGLRVAREATEERRSRYASADPRVLTAQLTLAAQLGQAGHAEEAEQLFVQLGRARRQHSRPDLVLPNFPNQYAGFLIEQGRAQEAVEMFAQGYREVVDLYGEEHHHALVNRLNLANALIHCDREEEGMAHYDAVFRLDRDLPEGPLRWSTHRLIYSEGLRRTGRIEEARLHLDVWLKDASDHYPADHPALRTVQGIRARLDQTDDG